MPVRIIQPRNPVGIDRNNPLGARTLALYNGIDSYLHGPDKTMSVVGTPEFSTTPLGRGFKSSQNNQYLSAPVSGAFAPSEVTVFWAGVINGDGRSNFPYLAGVQYTGSYYNAPNHCFGIARDHYWEYGLLLYFNNSGVSAAISMGTNVFQYGKFLVLIGTVINGEANAYLNGKLVGTSASASTISYHANSRFVIAGGRTDLATHPNCTTVAAGYLKGGSTQAEVQSLTANIWQLFQTAKSFNFKSIISSGNRRRRLLMAS